MLLKLKKYLLFSGKCLCSASKSLQWINLILSFMIPVESETLHDSLTVFKGLNKALLFVSLSYWFQYR